jgi:hypothetical protein
MPSCERRGCNGARPFFAGAIASTSERIKAYIVKQQNYGAASATINRELDCLKRMFRLGFEQTPQLVGLVPDIPMLAVIVSLFRKADGYSRGYTG